MTKTPSSGNQKPRDGPVGVQEKKKSDLSALYREKHLPLSYYDVHREHERSCSTLKT
jgi:hypothetical protein